jgi:hypothetical protein
MWVFVFTSELTKGLRWTLTLALVYFGTQYWQEVNAGVTNPIFLRQPVKRMR